MDNMQNSGMNNTQNSLKKELPMKWYKFLIWFALPVSVLMNVVNAKTYLTGGLRIVEKDVALTGEEIYRLYPDVKTLDMVFGILLIIVALYAALTWFCMFKRKKNGPMLLYGVYAINFIMNIAYGSALVSIVGGELVMSSVIGMVAGMVFAIWANYKYFTRRQDIFCN